MEKLEHILIHSSERYYDTETGRSIVAGRHERQLVMIPYEVDGEIVTPVTVHFIGELRSMIGEPQYLKHLERLVMKTPNAEARLAQIRKRMKVFASSNAAAAEEQ